jgi:hypothetical protein
MDPIRIVQHESPEPVNPDGVILHPFSDWDKALTGANWFSKPDHEKISTGHYIPLGMISANPWTAINELGINTAAFKDQVKYACPYTNYEFFWGVPIAVLPADASFWMDRAKVPAWKRKKVEDKGYMRRFYPLTGNKGFHFTHIQRALLGTGYTDTCRMHEGESFLYDAILLLENTDLLASKVWMWFNKKK